MLSGFSPEIDGLQLDEAAHQEAGARQQDERQSDFEDDERAPQFATPESAAHALTRVLEWFHHVPLRRLKCRHQSEQERREHRHRHAEQENRYIQPNHRFPRDQPLGNQQHQPFDPDVGKQAAEQRAATR